MNNRTIQLSLRNTSTVHMVATFPKKAILLQQTFFFFFHILNADFNTRSSFVVDKIDFNALSLIHI